jgi:hypothetical protein
MLPSIARKHGKEYAEESQASGFLRRILSPKADSPHLRKKAGID